MPANTLETSTQDAEAAKRLDAFGELVLLAPVSGVIYPLERVPDPVFSQKLAGDGISIDPTDNILRAPCPGEIVQQHAAGHAVTLKTAGDLEVLMHVGHRYRHLKGEGVYAEVKIGDRVDTGAALIEFDLDYVATNAKSLLTEVIISNGERVTNTVYGTGTAVVGKTPVLTLTLEWRSRDSGGANRPDRYFGGNHSAKSERFACSARSCIEQRSQDVQERCPPPARRSFCERAQCDIAAGSRDSAGRQGRLGCERTRCQGGGGQTHAHDRRRTWGRGLRPDDRAGGHECSARSPRRRHRRRWIRI